jgi:hypothetical protein
MAVLLRFDYDSAGSMRETWNAARVGLMVVLGLIVTFAVYRYVDERSSTDSGYGVYASRSATSHRSGWRAIVRGSICASREASSCMRMLESP